MVLYLLLDPPSLTLFMTASKLISEFNPSGEDGADIREEGDKIDSNELRGAAERKEKVKDEEATTKEEVKKRHIKISAILNKVFN